VTIVYVEYVHNIDDEKLNCFTRINFNKHLSSLYEICRYLDIWKPINAAIISVKNENENEIINIEICRDSLREYLHLFDHTLLFQKK